MICTNCGEDKPKKDFGKIPRRLGGVGRKCKLCIAEDAKRSIRVYKQMPVFKLDVEAWPRVKIESEIEWLEEKLAVLRKALRRA